MAGNKRINKYGQILLADEEPWGTRASVEGNGDVVDNLRYPITLCSRGSTLQAHTHRE